MNKNPPPLEALVAGSVLLDDTRKRALTDVLPGLSAERRVTLEELLRGEERLLAQSGFGRVKHAAVHGDERFFEDLDAFFLQASKRLTKAEETMERAGDDTALEHFFGAA